MDAVVGGLAAIGAGLAAAFDFGYSSCDVAISHPAPPPPPPPTAQMGLRENPGARPSGQANGASPKIDPSKFKVVATVAAAAAAQAGHQPLANGGTSAAAANALASLTAAGATAAFCTLTGACTPQDDQSDPGCQVDGAGWTDYGPVDIGHGGRATGVTACLDSSYLESHPGTSTETNKGEGIVPPGYDWARKYVGYLGGKPSGVNACHLLGAQLSGSGTNLENLATCGTDGNSYVGKPNKPIKPMDSMLHFEDKVRQAVDDGNIVLYRVTPVYSGSRTVPYEMQMSYVSWDRSGRLSGAASDTVSNLIYTAGSGWKNLGTAVDSRTGADAPVAGQ